MASNSQGLRIGIQVVLAIAIVALGYWLYLSITGPWEEVERQQEMTRLTRVQMDEVRNALIIHERQTDDFPGTLDSLLLWIATDSFAVANRDSLFGADFDPDSLFFSPRTGARFEYTLNDTGRVAIYLLKDPDSDDQIGSASPDITRINAASWE